MYLVLHHDPAGGEALAAALTAAAAPARPVASIPEARAAAAEVRPAALLVSLDRYAGWAILLERTEGPLAGVPVLFLGGPPQAVYAAFRRSWSRGLPFHHLAGGTPEALAQRLSQAAAAQGPQGGARRWVWLVPAALLAVFLLAALRPGLLPEPVAGAAAAALLPVAFLNLELPVAVAAWRRGLALPRRAWFLNLAWLAVLVIAVGRALTRG